MPAMPPVITMNSSLRVRLARYGRMNSGASTMPRKILAAVESPTAPPTLSVRSSSQEKPCTSGGRMRQWNKSVVNTLITSKIGKACSASTNSAPGTLSS
jgi:hypothetical protein